MKAIPILKSYGNRLLYAKNNYQLYFRTMLGSDMRGKIAKVNVELCTRCNLNCLYCELDRSKKRKISHRPRIARGATDNYEHG